MAAAIGSAARAGSRRSPATNSRLSSSPTTKKKIASRPSAAQVDMLRCRCSDFGSDRELRHRLVGLRPRRVRPYQRRARGREQQHAADGFLAQDLGEPLRLRPRAAREQSQSGWHWSILVKRRSHFIPITGVAMAPRGVDSRVVRREVGSAVSSPTPERHHVSAVSAVPAPHRVRFRHPHRRFDQTVRPCRRGRRPQPYRSPAARCSDSSARTGRASPPPFVCCSG